MEINAIVGYCGMSYPIISHHIPVSHPKLVSSHQFIESSPFQFAFLFCSVHMVQDVRAIKSAAQLSPRLLLNSENM
jgi:hypothetical protein